MNRRLIVIVCGAALLFAAAVAVVVALRNCQQPPTPPDVPVAALPAEVRVKAVERKSATVARPNAATASRAVAIVCGGDEATADRYEARNDVLRSIARRHDLPEGDVAALMDYLASTNDVLRVERVAALKNDVMNLLRSQEPPVEGLAETLIVMFEGRGISTPNSPTHAHPPAVLDYCVQHLGAMQGEITDDATRRRIREVLVGAARRAGQSYAGTALYSLADDRRATFAQNAELKRLTLALCRPEANSAARIAAIQLAGERGYAEALPLLRETLSGERRDAVLDIVAIGSVGLLGTADDIALIERFKGDARRSAAVEAAIKRIKGREGIGTPTAGKEASLMLRPLLRAVQPHEIRSDSFGGLGAVPPDKENIVGGNNCGFATRS